MSDEKRSSAERNVTFSEIFRIGEYRAIFSATQLSWIGEYMAKSAVMALVFQQTESVALSAAAFAISYAPWAAGGPFLAALAERYRYRGVMVTCDVLRFSLMSLVTVVAVAGLPSATSPAQGGVPIAIWFIIGLLFAEAMLAPPAQAARSATLPLILTGDRVVLGIAVNQSSGQAMQVVGYMAGALIAAVNPPVALMINATTFAASALIVRLGLHNRPPAMRAEYRSNLTRETRDGFRMVFGTPALRAIAIVVFASMLFAIVPEGLAIGWADQLAEGESGRRGLYQGLIMVANPVGHVLGGLLIARLILPSLRRRLIPVLAVLAPLSLVPSLTDPAIGGVVVMAAVCGFMVAGMLPAANGLFVQALPNGFRARAFGVMNSGMQIIQGTAILLTGLLTELLPLPVVVGLWSAAGVVLMIVIGARWPKPAVFTDAIAAARAANAAADAAKASGTPTSGTPTSDTPTSGTVTAGGTAPAEVPPQGRRASGEPSRSTHGQPTTLV